MSIAIDSETRDRDITWDEALPDQIQGSSAGAEETPACQACRKKKSKCSRQQPCSQCLKSGTDCVYEAKRSTGGVKIGVIERLHQRIDLVENMFLGQSMLMQKLIMANEQPIPGSQIQSSILPDLATYTERLKQSLAEEAAAAQSADQCSRADALEAAASRKRKRDEYDTTACPATSRNGATLARIDAPQGVAAVETTLETYFKVIHPWIPVLHPATFLRRAREQTRSVGISLIIQAITAVASPYTPETRANVAPEELDNYVAALRHNIIAQSIASCTKEAIQALILVTFDAIKIGQGSPWHLVAVICHKLQDLQLNSEEKTQKNNLAPFFSQSPEPLEPPMAWIEVEERRRVFWGAFLLDRFCSIVTGSNPNIASRRIQRRLPCDGYMWELDQCVETSFFKIHQQNEAETEAAEEEAPSPFPPAYTNSDGPIGIGGLAYTIEATESLFLVTKFHERHHLDFKSSNQLSSWLTKFRQLDSRLLQWELCLTHRWREVRVVDGYIDPNLTIAHLTHNASIISLHSKLAYPPPQARAWLSSLVSGASKEACIMAAMKIDRIAKRFLDASSGIPPHQFALCLYIAGQALLNCKSTETLDTASSIIASLDQVAQRLSSQTQPLVDTPAARLRDALSEEREAAQSNKGKDLALARPRSDTELLRGQPSMNMIDFSTMLHNFATSPSSGGSVLGLNFFDQDSPTEFDRSLLTASHLAAQNIAPPALRMTETVQPETAEEESEFDFMAELRKLETKARDHSRRQKEQSQGK